MNLAFGILFILAGISTHGYSIDTYADEDCIDPDEFICAVEHEVIRLTNKHREDKGLGQLVDHPRISYVARDWSYEQAERGNISHDGFASARNRVYMEKFGSMDDLFLAGENVAMSSHNLATPEAVAKHFVSMWWNSSGHRANMLGRFKYMGASVVKNSRGYYGTQIFAN